jgi:hypothetical protein
MIEPILGVTIGAYIGIYIISFFIYVNEFIIDFRSFKATSFFEYVIASLILLGSIVPILNSIYAYKIINYESK